MGYTYITQCIKTSAIEIQSVLESEHKLETILLGIGIPVGPVPVPSVVGLILNFPCRYTEGNSLVRFSSDLQTYKLT